MRVAKTWVVPLAAGALTAKRQSTVRSVAYYRDAWARTRSAHSTPSAEGSRRTVTAPEVAPDSVPVPGKSSIRWNLLMLEYLRMVVSLIDVCR